MVKQTNNICEYCETAQATETHKLNYLNDLIYLCEDCAIVKGYRTTDWYKDNQKLLADKYNIHDYMEI